VPKVQPNVGAKKAMMKKPVYEEGTREEVSKEGVFGCTDRGRGGCTSL
jgi:hypothetical protein